MVKRKIIYSRRAKDDLKNIYEFFNNRNKSLKYSNKLLNEFRKIISLLSENCEIGKQVENLLNVRILIKGNYKIIYKINEKTIDILSIWDTRQNPDSLIFK